ncbi:NUDIX hydrolase domain-like protein [Pilaira anomala]|nr:NUDIX hydrolase domain-like protein [Pilaira anomala]
MTVQEHVRVGVGCFVIHQDPNDAGKKRFLIGQRKGSHGANSYGLPGGHLDMFEDFATCAFREVLEETNLKLDKSQIRFITALNTIMPTEQKHYVTIFMYSQVDSVKDVKVMEPEKLQGTWKWVTLDELKSYHLFLPLQVFLEQKDLDLSFLE